MFGLTDIGVVHTAFSLVAVAAGVASFFRYKGISALNVAGKIYIFTTAITCLTGFFIFQHGGFGKPHMLGILTLAVLAIAVLSGGSALFGKWSPYVSTLSYSATFLFHMIPAVTETTTRLPLGAPLLPNADAPQLQVITLILLVCFLIGATLQVRRMRAR